MDKLQFNKFSVLALGLAVFLGLALGNIFTSTIKGKQINNLRKQYEQILSDQIKNSEVQIKYRDDSIKSLLAGREKDSIVAVNMKRDILLNSKKTEVKREEAKKFTKNEKLDYLVNRYTTDSLKFD